MTVIGIDDTDSRERGMCTTYLAARVAARVREEGGAVERQVLVRLNPAIEHKTRGNAALAIHTDLDVEGALGVARETVEALAVTDDPRTNPGVVVAPDGAISEPVIDFARRAVRERLTIDGARRLIGAWEYRHADWKESRGLIGALAAVGAWAAFDEWTCEYIAYREAHRRGTPREVDHESVFAAADWGYPTAWDTVDRDEGSSVCVPRAPGPILYGIRGDDPDVVRGVADRIESEPVERTGIFVTNQGTDAHLREGSVGELRDGRAYRVAGTVSTQPETRRGGHVFFSLEDGDASLACAAFEPTKRFRERVRALRVGDRLAVCGEVSDGTLKLEKFAVRDLVRTESAVPSCPDCGRSMESAGRDQGYRCRDCGTGRDGKIERAIERDLKPGWYEVPPCARRHIARPLVRGGFDAPIHPER
ncbi:tRNA(Ile)(2)-agmatinylcytidine synthase [Halococcus agarilyticus]|uniref:tRNA(Ile)(2)-agmatinylcytidine synthase n=1 Tax=Halococcus agarilyticus TaxID=1232219 RepID=UPI000677E5B8|nr:tRNA(Ile)(2)-agmatinylcytidine synthase [Halococcus agarilyticus]